MDGKTEIEQIRQNEWTRKLMGLQYIKIDTVSNKESIFQYSHYLIFFFLAVL